MSSSSPSGRGSGACGVPAAALRHLYREAVVASGELAQIQRTFQGRWFLYDSLVCGSALFVLVGTLLGSTILSLLASGASVVSLVALLRTAKGCDAPALADLLADWNRYLDRVSALRVLAVGQPAGDTLPPDHAALGVELNRVAAGLRARSIDVVDRSFPPSDYFDS